MNKLKFPITEQDHIRGSLGAPIKIVEYGDFECPYCALAYPQIERVIQEFGEHVCFAYRHFPLRRIHPNAELAAIASEGANLQDFFWEMHHALFENYELLSPQTILTCAEELALDMKRFQTDLVREELHEVVLEDFASGIRSGVNGTPTVFFNDTRFDQPVDYPALRRFILSVLDAETSIRF